MALSLREIKRRIKSVKNTQQITKAMEMVAAARLKRAQARLLVLRKFQREFEDALAKVSLCLPSTFSHPLITSFQTVNNMVTLDFSPDNLHQKSIALMVISADRGLCGAYNSNVMRQVLSFLKKYDVSQIKKVFILGKKAVSFLKRSEYADKCEVLIISPRPDYKELKLLFKKIIKLGEEKRVDEIYVIYTQFLSTTKHIITEERVIPLSFNHKKELKEQKTFVNNPILEPDAESLINNLVSSYLEASFYQCYLESQASEQAARMIAMQASGKNAKEMLDRLTLAYNKARQAGITKEILEVVSGAEALR